MSNGGHIEGHKACGHCKEVKPFDQFYIRKTEDIRNPIAKNVTQSTQQKGKENLKNNV